MRMARRLCAERDGGILFDYDPAIAHNFHAARQARAVDAWPAFAALRVCPLLVLRGERSDLLSKEVAKRMVEEHGSAELVTVPGVRHAPDLSEPAALAAVARLLDRVARQS
jgi:pimeloyl-ACP methyl ester carboxylesterase